jgi:hypothetical protein
MLNCENTGRTWSLKQTGLHVCSKRKKRKLLDIGVDGRTRTLFRYTYSCDRRKKIRIKSRNVTIERRTREMRER